jgi:organic hydroperoxide reductase OsmC/OhrA
MSEFSARVSWSRNDVPFTYETYDRNHDWVTGSGVPIPASAAPDYRGAADRVNPEEAFVAALAGCHMLTFLAVAARKQLVVERYEDNASGVLAKNAEGRLAMTEVVLRPRVVFGGDRAPDAAELARMHETAHRGCFIASSVRTEVRVEPQG